MKTRNWRALGVVAAIVAVLGSAAVAGPLTFAELSLGPGTIEGGVARFEVSLVFAPDTSLGDGYTEQLGYFRLDVSGSDALLTGAGSDYSAFAFDLSPSASFQDWGEIWSFGPTPMDSAVEFQNLPLGQSLAAGTYTLGVLSVNFGSLGLAAGTEFSVAINALDPFYGEPASVVGVDIVNLADGIVEGFELVMPTFAQGAHTVVVPGGAEPVPEPASLLLLLLGCGALAVRGRRSRRR